MFECRLLIQDTATSAARQIAVEKEGSLDMIRWSPEGDHVAYLTSSAGKSADEDGPKQLVAAKKLTIVALQDGKKTSLSQDAAAPQWSADGDSLYFFQRESDKWKAHRSSGWKGSSAPVTTALPAAGFPSPGAFTKNGERFAVLDGDKIKIATSDGRTVSEFPLPREMEMRSLKWSPDDRWLVAKVNDTFTHERSFHTLLLEPATGRLEDL